jgi:hypothetical protein
MQHLNALALLLLCAAQLSAQLYQRGDYAEYGVNECGTFTTFTNPPPGYHPNNSFGFPGFGIVADPARDGWETGDPVPFCGDYVMPGSPVEGFSVQVGSAYLVNKNISSFDSCSSSDIPRTQQEIVNAGPLRLGFWSGNRGGLSVRQATAIRFDQAIMIHRVKLCNNTGSALDSVYYQRFTDPDPEWAYTNNFFTQNRIEVPASGGSLVEASGTSIPECRIALLTPDSRARASIGGFFDALPSWGYTGTFGYINSGTLTADVGVQLTFFLGNLEAGQCDCMAFAYVFKRSDYEKTLGILSRTCSAFDDFERHGDAETLSAALFGEGSPVEGLPLSWQAYPGGLLISDLEAGQTLQVFDMQGRLVHQGLSQGNVHVVQGLQPGIYILQAADEQGVMRQAKAAVR